MKILLMGEYSNVHATLAEGLRKLDMRLPVPPTATFGKTIHEISTW